MTWHGVDLSSYQAGLDLSRTDAQFAIFRAVRQGGQLDTSVAGFVNQARRLSLPYGLYRFVGTGDIIRDADQFLDYARDLGAVGEAVLVLDWEGSGATSVGRAKQWLDHVYAKTGVRAWIYMSQSETNAHDWSPVEQHHPLWAARYNDTLGKTGAWKTVTAWQYTDAHATGGMRVDGDRFYGDRHAWDAMAGKTTAPGTARAVWDENLTLWVPTDADRPDDQMIAGQQLNQVRGNAQALYENTKQVKKALRAVAKDPRLSKGTRDQMLEVLG